MVELVESCVIWSSFLVDRATAFLIQSTLVVVLASMVAWLLRHCRPRVRYWLWQLVAIKLLLMPWWLVQLPVPTWWATAQLRPVQATTAPAIESSAFPMPGNGHARGAHPSPAPYALDVGAAPSLRPADSAPKPVRSLLGMLSWQSWLVAVWLTVVTLQIGRLVTQRWRLSRLLRSFDTLSADEFPLVRQCAEELALASAPGVVVTAVDTSPFVCGFLHPKLVLPVSLLKATTPKQQHQIVLHELAHIRRHDLRWCWIPQLMTLAFWFHPAVHWVAFRIRMEQELACDELAMRYGKATAAEYAHTLVDAASQSIQSFIRARPSSHKLIEGARP